MIAFSHDLNILKDYHFYSFFISCIYVMLQLVDLGSWSVVPDDVPQGPGHDVLLLGGCEAAAVGGLVGEEKPVTILEGLELALEKTGEGRAHKLARGDLLEETSWEYFKLVKISIKGDDVSFCDPVLPHQRICDATHILSVLHVGG